MTIDVNCKTCNGRENTNHRRIYSTRILGVKVQITSKHSVLVKSFVQKVKDDI